MRLISTLCLLLFAFIVPGQDNSHNSQSKEVIVKTWCTKRVTKSELTDQRIPDSNSISKAFAGRISGLVAPPAKKDTAKTSITIRIHCLRTVTSDDKPLIVIDGIPVINKLMGSLNPNDIENIAILKAERATAIYGSLAVNGVIIITTKQIKLTKFIIKDFLDGSRITGATVSFISSNKKDTLQFVANDSGIVATNKLKQSTEYEMLVSSIGYAPVNQNFKNGYGYSERNVLLTREMKTCEEAIVSSIHCGRRIGCGYNLCCRVGGILITSDFVETNIEKAVNGFKIYPNPVQRGAAFNLQFKNEDNSDKIVRMISMDGKPILTQTFKTNKGNHLFQVQTDARWSAGTYFLQLVYENGRILASDKLIIQ